MENHKSYYHCMRTDARPNTFFQIKETLKYI